jgi:hypothetical protein
MQNSQEQNSCSIILPLQDTRTSDELVREWLVRFGAIFEKDIAPYLPIWQEELAGITPDVLLSLFRRAMKTCKFFPKIAEILEPLESAEKAAALEAAEKAWEQVLEIRRAYWNPDIPAPFERAVAALSERVRQAARAAGIFRDFESVEALHTWAKKRFVESFIAYGELEQDQFLLPDGEIKNILDGCAEMKALPVPSRDWKELRARGLAYAGELKSDPSQQPDLKRASRAVARELTPRPPMRSLDEQKQILRERGLLK